MRYWDDPLFFPILMIYLNIFLEFRSDNINITQGSERTSNHHSTNHCHNIPDIIRYVCTVQQEKCPQYDPIWKTAICPVYKKGKTHDPKFYRPISITCISCKLTEHIVTSHIMTHARNLGVLDPFQHGCRRALFYETQLNKIEDDITIKMDAGKQTDRLIMDFSNAFDHGIRGKTNQWIKKCLGNQTQSVVVEGWASSNIPVDSGVPQGSVLFYINDIHQPKSSSVLQTCRGEVTRSTSTYLQICWEEVTWSTSTYLQSFRENIAWYVHTCKLAKRSSV